jgi:hypothetical protein
MSKAKLYSATGEPQDIGSLEADDLVVNGVNILTALEDLQNQLNSLNSSISNLSSIVGGLQS